MQIFEEVQSKTINIVEADTKQFHLANPIQAKLSYWQSLTIVAWFLLAALIPYAPKVNYQLKNSPPFESSLLGRDGSGRDVLVHGVMAVRLYILPIVIMLGVAFGIGLILAMLGAELRPIRILWFDAWKASAGIISVILDILEALPGIVIVLILVTNLEHPNLNWVAMILGVIGSAKVARELILKIRVLKSSDFIDGAIASGVSWWQIVFKHILYRNSFTVLVNQAINLIILLILLEISFTYIADTVWSPCILYPPDFPSWGKMIFEGSANLSTWWIVAWPMFLLFLLLNSFRYIGNTVIRIREEAK